MFRRHLIRRSLLVVAVVVVLAVVASAVIATTFVRRPFPTTSGDVELPGLGAQVTVQRDGQGVPQIYADTAADLFRAQGYVHAQDRFFEMDYRRHVTSGRLAELVGNDADAIQADRVIRTFGWRHVAEQEWDLLTDETRANLTAYAEGVNAYLAERDPSQIALEYTVLDVQVDVAAPEPWDPIDSVAWLKAMAWDLRGNYDDELARAATYGIVGDVDEVEELFPAYGATKNAPILDADELQSQRDARVAARDAADAEADADADAADAADAAQGDGATPDGATDVGASDAAATQTTGATGATTAADASGLPVTTLVLGDEGLQSAIDAASAALAAVPHTVASDEGTGSNSWVVSGEHTASGKPLLANDPHLGLAAPSIWSQVGLHCRTVGDACPYDVAGFSFAGFPGVIIGHNGQLAWGLTNLGADVTDFFVEAVDDSTYLRDGVWEPLTLREEIIKVNGGDDISLLVRSTVHGPIVSGALAGVVDALHTPTGTAPGAGPSYGVSLAWTALTPGRTADAVFALDRAADADDVAAAAALFAVPSQNIVFATTDGHIGYQAPGQIPTRARVTGDVPSDGTWPRPGWDSRYDWTGFVDPVDMPAVLDPAEGFVVAANQAVADRGAGPFLTSDWDYGYRSQRIRALLEGQIAAGTGVTTESMSALQSDSWSAYAYHLVPALVDVDLDDAFTAEGQDLLRDWDYDTDTGSAAAAYFAAVWSHLLEGTFGDDLPASMQPAGDSRWLAVLDTLLDDPTSPWWDDRRTINVVETRDKVLTNALTDARLELTTTLGKNASEWRWGRLHQLQAKHPVLGGDSIPGIVRALVNPRAVELPGGSSIVNANAWDASARRPNGARDFSVTAGPSMRMVVDLADLDASRWVVVTGTSGHPGHPHYADQLGTWAAGETFAWPFTADAVAAAADDTLTLSPAR